MPNFSNVGFKIYVNIWFYSQSVLCLERSLVYLGYLKFSARVSLTDMLHGQSGSFLSENSILTILYSFNPSGDERKIKISLNKVDYELAKKVLCNKKTLYEFYDEITTRHKIGNSLLSSWIKNIT